MKYPVSFPITIMGKPRRIVISKTNHERMLERHFGDPCDARAGNFCREWNTPENLLTDFAAELSDDIAEHIQAGKLGMHNVTIECQRAVGWSTTGEVSDCPSEALVKRTFPNGKGNALFVLSGRDDVEAPLSSDISFVYFLSSNDGKKGSRLTIELISCYPGEAPGELVGDVTAETGLVFFDWGHPGESPPRRTPEATLAAE